jgi:enoyl-[acyl-carrier protein] reductase II
MQRVSKRVLVNNRITELFGIKYPIIQAGMVWVSGWKLASAVSNNGGLGLIGAGSMKPDLLSEHIKKCFEATEKPFGVNIPLLRGDAVDLINTVINENVKIVFTSAGHPGKFIDLLKKNDITVIHVVPSLKYALKAESVGCDAVVGEGVEAGGHNGADEITTFSLITQLSSNLKIPVIAAGGIVNGAGILAAFALGAEGVQIGTLFAATEESSAHINYKNAIINASDTDSILILKKIGLVRALKNDFTSSVQNAEEENLKVDDLKLLLGAKREMKGIFEGDTINGLLEAGQGSGLIKNINTVQDTINLLVDDFDNNLIRINRMANFT